MSKNTPAPKSTRLKRARRKRPTLAQSEFAQQLSDMRHDALMLMAMRREGRVGNL